VKDLAGRLRADLDDRRVRVLGGVGERFGDHVVGRRPRLAPAAARQRAQ
jgi:hypothetical protein